MHTNVNYLECVGVRKHKRIITFQVFELSFSSNSRETGLIEEKHPNGVITKNLCSFKVSKMVCCLLHVFF